MYALAAIALAEGLVDRVLVLCPSLTIEEELLSKFTALAGNAELAEIMNELGAIVAIPRFAEATRRSSEGTFALRTSTRSMRERVPRYKTAFVDVDSEAWS